MAQNQKEQTTNQKISSPIGKYGSFSFWFFWGWIKKVLTVFVRYMLNKPVDEIIYDDSGHVIGVKSEGTKHKKEEEEEKIEI